MREWLVIEDSRSRAVFAPDELRVNPIMGYIPRDVVEGELGIKIVDGCTWFTRDDDEKMRAHPEWRTTEPPGRDPREAVNPWQLGASTVFSPLIDREH